MWRLCVSADPETGCWRGAVQQRGSFHTFGSVCLPRPDSLTVSAVAPALQGYKGDTNGLSRVQVAQLLSEDWSSYEEHSEAPGCPCCREHRVSYKVTIT